MCFSPRKPQKSPTTLRRRYTFNPASGIQAIKRAMDLALFASPTVIHFQGRDIYLSAAIQKYLRLIFDQYRQGQTFLSREKFENFLVYNQGETISKLTKDQYNFQEFLQEWWMKYGLDAFRPSPEEKDLSKPISNYFIASSHNTYLSGHQWIGNSNADAYRKVLRGGCRCVEIDVWDGASPGSSPDRVSKSQGRPDHSRGISGSSMHSVAATLMGKGQGKLEQAKQMLGDKKSHSRSPSSTQVDINSPTLTQGTLSLGPEANADRLEGSRARTRSRRSLRKCEPIVMHGYTLTTPVGFREVCRAIRETGFETTNLPIIISLEVHADFEQQEVMVEIMKEEWAGLLVDKPLDGCPTDRMPRLEQLLNKILIKVKRPKTESTTVMSSLAPMSVMDDDASGSEDERIGTTPSIKKKKSVIGESLGALAIYTHSEHFKRFETEASKNPSHIFSISESRILELYATKHKEMLAHNRDYFMRAFPKGSRFDSSNQDPSLFWRKGVQMVAMNWQNLDEGMMLNEAMFAGEQGWVLKPPGYRSEDASQAEDVVSNSTLNLCITVLAGQHIPLPEGVSNARSLRPLVKCELHVEKKSEERSSSMTEGGGRPRDDGKIKTKVETAPGKTDHPDFGSEKNEIQFLNMPKVVDQLSFVRFKVEDATSRLLGISRPSFSSWACIRLDRLMPGYRFIKLMDPKGNPTAGMLLVRIDKKFV